MHQKPTQNELEKLILNQVSKKKIAQHYGVGTTTIARWFKSYGLNMNVIQRSHIPEAFTEVQKSILTGSMLGDGWLTCTGRSKNARFRFKQAAHRQEYVQYIATQLIDFLVYDDMQLVIKKSIEPKPIRVNNKIERSKTETLESCYFWTTAHPLFTHMMCIWYPHNEKEVPDDLTLNKEVLLHWFLQDGSNTIQEKSYSKLITLSTCGFSIQDNDKLVQILYRDLAIKSHFYTGGEHHCIRISSSSYYDFLDMLSDRVSDISCFDYKFKRPKVKGISSGWQSPVLNYVKACQIRKLYLHNNTMASLAQQFGVSTSAIWRIINNYIYKNDSINISGVAEVRHGSS